MTAPPARARTFFTVDRNAAEVEAGLMTVGHGTCGQVKIHHWPGRENGVLRIGSYCSIARGVEVFLGGNHRPDWVSTYPFNTLPRSWPKARGIPGQPTTRGDVEIGSDIWIGASAVIMSGVSIGHGAVIGARAVVARNVPPYAIVAGNPARLVRYRFDEGIIRALLAIRWWDWPVERVADHADRLASGDLASFIEDFLPREGRGG